MNLLARRAFALVAAASGTEEPRDYCQAQGSQQPIGSGLRVDIGGVDNEAVCGSSLFLFLTPSAFAQQQDQTVAIGPWDIATIRLASLRALRTSDDVVSFYTGSLI